MRRVALAALCLITCGCGGLAAAPASTDPASGALDVFAAASLTSAFNEAGAAFHAAHPKASVRFNFAGSAALAAQIDEGAPADVFASADAPNMQKVVAGGATLSVPRTFATNRLEIVVAAGNPRGIRGLADLANPALVVVLCAPAVPCGNYAGQALAAAGVKVAARSQEQDVNAVVTKVALGEADAGIVYVTDVRAGGSRVQGVEIPDSQNVVASYPVAALRGGSNARGGQAFVDFLLSAAGQGILGRYGFAKP